MESDILDSLEQLGYDGALLEETALLRAAEGGLSSREYVELCRWLVSRLRPLCALEESITSGPDDMESLQIEVSALLRELHCPYEEAVAGILKGSVRTTRDHLQLVLFLSSELQAAQILRSRTASVESLEENPVLNELRSMSETLTLPPPSARSDPAHILSLIRNKVDEVLQKVPSASVGNPVLTKPLSSAQWARLRDINSALRSEYECRRRMLIKRLDVTVQSFGWSDRAKVRVDRMAQVYQPQRHSLRPQSEVQEAELLAAREEICNVVKTSSGYSREKTCCALNKVRMGRVPDRGGRPSEIQAPPPEMPPWQKRQDGGGRGGGGGGGWGRGGRGGGGGGGGWGGGGGGGGGGHRGGGGDWGGGGGGHRGGGWNQGGYHGYGGKRGRYQY